MCSVIVDFRSILRGRAVVYLALLSHRPLLLYRVEHQRGIFLCLHLLPMSVRLFILLPLCKFLMTYIFLTDRGRKTFLRVGILNNFSKTSMLFWVLGLIFGLKRKMKGPFPLSYATPITKKVLSVMPIRLKRPSHLSFGTKN